MNASVAGRRLRNQGIAHPSHRRPADVVAWFGAVQAQEYEAAKWGIGLRLRDGARNAAVEGAFDRGQILRTHIMRPTWHFVAPADIRWLLELTAPRVHRVMAPYNRRLELDAGTLRRGTAIIERALRDGRHLTREELAAQLRWARLVATGQRLANLVMYAELEGVVCSGPRRGKQFTYALLAERARGARGMPRDDAVAELVIRYFRSHGPATIRDFVWWSGLTTADARRGLEMSRARREEIDSRTYWSVDAPFDRQRTPPACLLPIYDEYLVAYRDRQAVPHGPSVIATDSRVAVTFHHALVIAGQVAGTWRLTRYARRMSIAAALLRPLSALERRALAAAVERYERFQDVPVELAVS